MFLFLFFFFLLLLLDGPVYSPAIHGSANFLIFTARQHSLLCRALY